MSEWPTFKSHCHVWTLPGRGHCSELPLYWRTIKCDGARVSRWLRYAGRHGGEQNTRRRMSWTLFRFARLSFPLPILALCRAHPPKPEESQREDESRTLFEAQLKAKEGFSELIYGCTVSRSMGNPPQIRHGLITNVEKHTRSFTRDGYVYETISVTSNVSHTLQWLVCPFMYDVNNLNPNRDIPRLL